MPLLCTDEQKKEMSKAPNHWDEIAKAVILRNSIAPDTVIVGNGDVLSREQGNELANPYGLDGIMIGRGILHNLFVFNQLQVKHSIEEMLRILLEHIELYEETWRSEKSYEPLKRFYKLYINGFDGASKVRAKLMETNNYEEAKLYIDSLL